MSKQITQHELADVVTRLLTNPEASGELDTDDKFRSFMEDIAAVVCTHCGGEVLNGADNDLHPEGAYMVGIHANDSLPPNGGIWADYDPEGSLFDR